eukprot:gene6886-11047_t
MEVRIDTWGGEYIPPSPIIEKGEIKDTPQLKDGGTIDLDGKQVTTKGNGNSKIKSHRFPISKEIKADKYTFEAVPTNPTLKHLSVPELVNFKPSINTLIHTNLANQPFDQDLAVTHESGKPTDTSNWNGI